MDGGILSYRIDGNGGDIAYFTNIAKEKVLNYYKNNVAIVNRSRYGFTFQFAKFGRNHDEILSQNFVEPYVYLWQGTREQLLDEGQSLGCYKGCTYCAYCTKLIQLNSWKIPKDYPW